MFVCLLWEIEEVGIKQTALEITCAVVLFVFAAYRKSRSGFSGFSFILTVIG